MLIDYLDHYLRASSNTVSRESLLFHKFVFDLKLEVAKCGHSLLATTSEVDKDGYDVALFVNSDVTFVQCKAFIRKPSSWKIHTSLLSPSAHDFSNLQFDGVPFSFTAALGGWGGAFVAMGVGARNGDLKVRYHHSDLLLIWALARRLVSGTRDVSDVARDFLRALQGDEPRAHLKRALVYPTADNASLAALLELESPIQHTYRSNLRHMFTEVEVNRQDADALKSEPQFAPAIAWLADRYSGLRSR